MDKPLARFHGLVQIWSFECLQAFIEMSRSDYESEEENESDYYPEVCQSKSLISLTSPLVFPTAIIRYLGSRFQETLMAVDDDNRTALHYAATIKDNGHFYNLLLHLGANPKSVDNVSFVEAEKAFMRSF
jgi:hypothetical protein